MIASRKRKSFWKQIIIDELASFWKRKKLLKASNLLDIKQNFFFTSFFQKLSFSWCYHFQKAKILLPKDSLFPKVSFLFLMLSFFKKKASFFFFKSFFQVSKVSFKSFFFQKFDNSSIIICFQTEASCFLLMLSFSKNHELLFSKASFKFQKFLSKDSSFSKSSLIHQ